MDEPLTTNNLIDFVHNFTFNKLNRHLRHNANLRHSHHFDSVKNQSEEHYHPTITENSSFGQKIKSISLRELSSDTFEEFIMNTNKASETSFRNSKAECISTLSCSFADGGCAFLLDAMCVLCYILDNTVDRGAYAQRHQECRIRSNRQRQE